MERLTKRNKHGQPCHNGRATSQMILNKLIDYEEKEAEGWLVVLPCKVGDTVYKIDLGDGFSEPRISERTIRGFKHTAYTNYPLCDIEFFGKTVFLTQKEAEAALTALNSYEAGRRKSTCEKSDGV